MKTKHEFIAMKKPIPVKVIEFTGKADIKTLEGFVYNIDGKTHYIIEGVDGEQWPLAKEIFDKTYRRVTYE